VPEQRLLRQLDGPKARGDCDRQFLAQSILTTPIGVDERKE